MIIYWIVDKLVPHDNRLWFIKRAYKILSTRLFSIY